MTANGAAVRASIWPAGDDERGRTMGPQELLRLREKGPP